MQRPFVFINVAVTTDGKLDSIARSGATISSTRDKERVDRLRAGSDAVMVGGRTLLGDDPKLTVKSPALRAERVGRGVSENPAKVAVVSIPELRNGSNFLNAGPARVIIFTTSRVTAGQISTLSAAGAEVHTVGAERVDLPRALEALHTLGIRRLMVEGGGTLNFELLQQGLVDELYLYVSPMIFGGSSAPTLADGDGLFPESAIHLERTHLEPWDDGGVLLRYRVLSPNN